MKRKYISSGIYNQIQNCGKKKYYTTLTTEIIENFLDELSKENKMKRKYYNKRKV